MTSTTATGDDLYGSVVQEGQEFPQRELDAAREAVKAYDDALAAVDAALAQRVEKIRALFEAGDAYGLGQAEMARLVGIPASTFRDDLPKGRPKRRRRA